MATFCAVTRQTDFLGSVI